MFPSKETNFKNTTDIIREINNLMSFYGFQNIDDWQKELKCNKSSFIQPDTIHPFEKQFVNILKQFTYVIPKQKRYDSNAIFGYSVGSKDKNASYHLHLLGIKDSFAEALLVALISLIVNKLLNKEIAIEINSMGDKDSAIKYYDEAKRLLKRKKKQLSPRILQYIEDNNMEKALTALSATRSDLLENLPSIMDFLSDEAQKHMYAFLDYMEQFGISYTLNPYLFASSKVWKHIIYNVYIKDEQETLLARGGRLDHAAELNGCSCEIVSAMFAIEQIGRKKTVEEELKNTQNPRFFFIQTGPLAKAQSVKLLDQMRNAHINISHTVSTMSLLDQYDLANKKGATHAIILGHKEALQGIVIIRELASQTQTEVKQTDLIKYLKKIR